MISTCLRCTYRRTGVSTLCVCHVILLSLDLLSLVLSDVLLLESMLDSFHMSGTLSSKLICTLLYALCPQLKSPALEMASLPPRPWICSCSAFYSLLYPIPLCLACSILLYPLFSSLSSELVSRHPYLETCYSVL
jgi:hypothetical protein